MVDHYARDLAGRTVDRVVQFSDGVFTVALTLLVVDLAVPDLAPGFSEAELQRALEARSPTSRRSCSRSGSWRCTG